LSANIASGARSVLDDEWLPEPLRQPLTHQACDDVARPAGWKTDNDAHRPRRIGLRESKGRGGRQRGSAGGQMQKISAGKFHSALPAFRATIPFRHHSGLMFAARTTLPHFSVYWTM